MNLNKLKIWSVTDGSQGMVSQVMGLSKQISPNIREIRIKEKQKVNAIFLSSLFKRNKNFLNLYKFILLSKITKKKVIALGGISKKNLRKLKLINVFGFAGISYFE